MPNTDTPIDSDPTRGISITRLVEQSGTVPFLGITDTGTIEYPNAVNAAGERFIEGSNQSFKATLSILPHAGEGELWAENEFVTQQPDGSVTVDLEALRDVHGLDTASLKQHTGMDLSELIDHTDPEPAIPITTHKDIIDRRRLALRTLGFDCRFRWQIASDRYSPGNMRAFFRRKIAACQKHGANDAFGWIRHFDWGGSVSITTIYPSKSYEVSPPDDTDIDLSTGELTVAKAPKRDETNANTDGDEDDDEPPTSTTIYYGDQMGYDFRGQQKLWVKPVIYIPTTDVMVPLPYSENDLSRKHTSNLMDDAVGWHEQILEQIDKLCTDVNQEIQRARLVAIDFDTLEFDIESFYRYIGINNDDYVEAAVDRATALASPSTQPTLWNLQLSLKLALLEHYNGNRAGKTYREYQELAGEILRHPATMITTAKEQHRIESETPNNGASDLDNSQTTLAESLEDVIELSGVTENSLDAIEAEEIEQRVQQRLPTNGGKA